MGCDCCMIYFLGFSSLAYITYRLLNIAFRILYPYKIASEINLKEHAGGNWAVITGSTDGIGKEYAFQLAVKGFNLLLVSRSTEKLNGVKQEILKATKTDIETVTFDFTETDVDKYQELLVKRLEKLDVGILINNVGLSYEYPELLHKIEGGLKRVVDILTVNTYPVSILTAAVLPQMVERNRGIIVNISSSASYNPMIMLSVYSSCKKYVSWLTHNVQREYAHTGIIFQTIAPMLVATNMSKISRTNYFIPSATAFVQSALKTIGKIDETSGYLSHQLQIELLGILPSFLVNRIIDGQTRHIHEKAINKKGREAAKAPIEPENSAY